jgi:two-component system response regulator NreC
MARYLHLAPRPGRTSAGSSPQRPIRVVVADNHALMRRSLRVLLELEKDIDVVAEAADLGALMSHLRRELPHVLVLDIGISNGSGIETISQLREQVPSTEIVVLTMDDDPGFAEPAINAGALGFVLKDRADTELAEAVRRAARGDEYLSPPVAARLESLGRIVAGEALTPREGEVLRLIALGHTSAEIATNVHLSRRTVAAYRARIHSKLGVTTRAQLVHYALGRGLVAV